jgi:ligand-binding sensor protein
MKQKRKPDSSEIMAADGQASSYQLLAKMPLLEKFEGAFRKATGMALKRVPANTRVGWGSQENAFCARMVSQPVAGDACRKFEAELQRKAGKTLRPQTGSCLAGLRLVVVPVVVRKYCVATWIGGPAFHRKPTRADFGRVAQRLGRSGTTEASPRLKAAFFRGPVVSEEQFLAGSKLLELFARYVGETLEDLRPVT